MAELNESPDVASLAKSVLRQKVQRILDDVKSAREEATGPVGVGGSPHPTPPPVPLTPGIQEEEEELSSAV